MITILIIVTLSGIILSIAALCHAGSKLIEAHDRQLEARNELKEAQAILNQAEGVLGRADKLRAAVKAEREEIKKDLVAIAVLGASKSEPLFTAMGMDEAAFPRINAERIHGGAGLPNQSETPTPLDGASCEPLEL